LVSPLATCPAAFHFRSGATVSTIISVQEGPGCDQFTATPSALTEPPHHPCETDSGSTDAAADTGIDGSKKGDALLDAHDGHDT
jgi:hypothetical protein